MAFFDRDDDTDHEDETEDQVTEAGRVRLIPWNELQNMKAPDPLVRGLINTSSLVILTGAPGSFKTFLAIGLALSVATQRMSSWEGYQVRAHGPVLYVAAEGASGMHERIVAWCASNNVLPEELDKNLFVVPDSIQLGNHEDRVWLAQQVDDMEPRLVVVDTKARTTTGLSENDASEQAIAIDYLDLLRKNTGACILVIHHSKREGAAPRGSSAWDGAVDIDLRVSRDDANSLEFSVLCHKRKDEADGCEHRFVMQKTEIPVPYRRDGAIISGVSSLVCVAAREDEGGVGGDVIARAVAVFDSIDTGSGVTRSELLKALEGRGLSGVDGMSAVAKMVRSGAIEEGKGRGITYTRTGFK